MRLSFLRLAALGLAGILTVRRGRNLEAGLISLVLAAAIGFAMPANANDADTAIGVPVVSPVQAEQAENVTITVNVTCTNPSPSGTSHGGCTGSSPNVTAGSVAFYAYLPASTTSCSSSGATLLALGTDTDGSNGWSVTFTPQNKSLVAGNVYFLRIVYTGNAATEIHGTNNSNLDTGCAALATLGVLESPLVEKRLVSGPTEADNVTDVLYPTLNPAPNAEDHGMIWIGLTEPQYFVYEIEINNDGPDAVDLIVSDVVGADFDLVGNPGVAGSCTVRTSQPPNSPNKQPEFIDIDVPADVTCTITVYIVTVENPGGGNELFEPTSCRVVGQTTGSTPEDVFDTYTLNEGVKVFDADPSSLTVGQRLLGPVGSLQLTCVPAPL